MKSHLTIRHFALAVALTLVPSLLVRGADEEGFQPIFNGEDLTGWKFMEKRGDGYFVENGMLVCPSGGGGNLFTEKEYSNFVLRFEFRIEKDGNNGVGIRAPLEGNAAYDGMEIQIIDDLGEKYAGKLKEWQYHGSLYGVVPAKRGAVKPAGEWNQEEIVCDGRKVKVTVNGQVVVDVNLDDIKDPEVLKEHPGLQRPSGHIGFLGHGSRVEFRNIRVKEL
jgi:hypothetical protein